MTTVEESGPAAYRFGPRETSGLLLGLRLAQLIVIFGGLALFVAGLSAGPAGLVFGVVVLIAALATSLVPVSGRTLDQWIPIGVSHAYGKFTGQASYRRPLTHRGHSPGEPLPLDLPGTLAGLSLVSIPMGQGLELGVLKDLRRHTYTAVASVAGRSFTLLESGERDRRVQAWGVALAALSREGSPVARVQWVERTLPDPGDALARHVRENAAVTSSSAVRASYEELIADAAPITQRHETFLSLTIDIRKARRQIKQAGGGQAGAAAVLSSELGAFEHRLRDAEVAVNGWLHPRDLAKVIRTAYEPGSAVWLDKRTPAHGDGAGVAPHAAGPRAAETDWNRYRTDDGVHATYTITEWPRLDVGADFLAPLLIDLQVRRTISLIAEPVPPRKAARSVTAARTKEVTDAALRSKTKQVTTARHQAEAAELQRREQELVAGHADYRFAAFMTVSAGNDEQLDRDALALENAAYQSRLELRRLYGEQDQAFAFTLPVGRGLK